MGTSTHPEGNEEADCLVKNAAYQERTEVTIQYGQSEYSSIMIESVKEIRQSKWGKKKIRGKGNQTTGRAKF